MTKRRNVYEMIHVKLQPLFDQLGDNDHVKLTSHGFMDLNIERLNGDFLAYVPQGHTNAKYIALSHYYKHPSGDMIPDPDIQVAIYDNMKMAEAITYQDSFGFQHVYTEDGMKVYLKRKSDLNRFLNFWLGQIKKQGFLDPALHSKLNATTKELQATAEAISSLL